MITAHVWRRYSATTLPAGVDTEACAYMNCRRPRAEHDRSATRGDITQDGIVAAREDRS